MKRYITAKVKTFPLMDITEMIEDIKIDIKSDKMQNLIKDKKLKGEINPVKHGLYDFEKIEDNENSFTILSLDIIGEEIHAAIDIKDSLDTNDLIFKPRLLIGLSVDFITIDGFSNEG